MGKSYWALPYEMSLKICASPLATGNKSNLILILVCFSLLDHAKQTITKTEIGFIWLLISLDEFSGSLDTMS